MKPLFAVAATGVVGFLLWKALLVVLLPLLGIAAGFLFLAVKVVFVAVMVGVAVWLFRRSTRREQQVR